MSSLSRALATSSLFSSLSSSDIPSLSTTSSLTPTLTLETTTSFTPEPTATLEATEEPVIIVVSSTTFTSYRPSRTRIPGVVYTDDPYSASGGALAANNGTSLNTGAVVGIALGLTGLTIAVALAILYYRNRKRDKAQKRALDGGTGLLPLSKLGDFPPPDNDSSGGSPMLAMANYGASQSLSDISRASAPAGFMQRPLTMASGSSSMPSAATWDPAMRASAAAALGFNRMSGVYSPVVASSAGSATMVQQFAPSSTAGPSLMDAERNSQGGLSSRPPLGNGAAGAGAGLLSPKATKGDGASRFDVASMAESYDAFSFVETLPELIGPPAPVTSGAPATNVKERTAAKRLALAAANAHLYTNTVAAPDTASILSREGRSIAPSFLAPSVAPSMVDRSASPLPTVDQYLAKSRAHGGLTADDASSIRTGAPFMLRRLPSTMSASTLQSTVVRALNYSTVPPSRPTISTAPATGARPSSPTNNSPPGSPTKTKGPRPFGASSPKKAALRNADGEGGHPPSPAPSANSQTPLLEDHPRIEVEAPPEPAPIQHPPNTFFVDVGRPFNVSLALAPGESAADYVVSLKNGKPVPSWLHLDYKTGMLGGTPYFNVGEWYDVEVHRDGEEAPLRELRIVLQEGHEDGRSEYASIWAESIRD